MSAPAPPIDRDAELLARAAELDMQAVEKVHAKLMTAEETAEIAELGRTYQRMTRSLRQTIALKSRRAREAAVTASHQAVAQPLKLPIIEGFATDDRAMVLQDAIERIVEKSCLGDVNRIATTLARFDDWVEAEDFVDEDLDAQVLRACQVLGLPEELAPLWRKLPRPTFSYDPASLEDEPDLDGPSAAAAAYSDSG